MAQTIGNRVIITITEASQKYDLSIGYLSLLARQHKVEAFKMGLMWVLYEDSLTHFLDQPRKPGPKNKAAKLANKDTIAQKKGNVRQQAEN
jgi:hypothetical protein